MKWIVALYHSEKVTHIQTRKCVWVEENYNCKKRNKIWHSSSQKYRNVKITTKSVVDSKQLYNKREKVKQKVESSGNRAAAYELTKWSDANLYILYKLKQQQQDALIRKLVENETKQIHKNGF